MTKQKNVLLPKISLILFVVIAGCGTDLYTKHLVASNLSPGEVVTLKSGYLDITHARNKSASFGMLSNIDLDVRQPLLIGLQSAGSLLIIGLIILHRKRSIYYLLPFGLILSGAIGNVVDRVRLGHVVDFIYFHIKHHFSWPIFNVADILITVGLMLLILQVLFSRGTVAAKHG